MKTWKKNLIAGTIALTGLVGAIELCLQDRIDYNRRLEAPEYQSYFQHRKELLGQLEQKSKEIDKMAWKEITEKLTGTELADDVIGSQIIEKCRARIKQNYRTETYVQMNKEFYEIKPQYKRPWSRENSAHAIMSIIGSTLLFAGGLAYLLIKSQD